MENPIVKKPDFLLIGGPNGAGKSTIYPALRDQDTSRWILDSIDIPTGNFINPDAIARADSMTDIQAGKFSLKMFSGFSTQGESFAYESTLTQKIAQFLSVRQEQSSA